jgi:hypothetical protein
MAIQSNFPALRPTLSLDFANTKTLDPRVTFARASEARYYDGKTFAKAEENLLLQSQDFTTTWTAAGQNASVTSNTTAAPDGTTTADTLTDDATSGIHRVAQTVTTANLNPLVLSVFAKYSTMQWITISSSTATGQWAAAKFDVQNGVLGNTSTQGAGWTATSSSITSVGNGWYRCVLVLTPGNSGATSILVSGATDGTTFTTSQRGSEVYSGTSSAVFVWGAQLEQRSTVTAYTPTTTQPITNYIPVLQTAAANVARFDHNPVTGESLGLLIEEQRTNLFLNSEVASGGIGVSFESNSVIAPDGALTMDRVVETTAAGEHYPNDHTFAPVVSTTYTWSCYAKALPNGAERRLLLRIAGGNLATAFFSLADGSISGAGGSGVYVSSGSQHVGNGVYRCWITWTATSTTSTVCRAQTATSANNISYTGDGYSGFLIWGRQLEVGAFPTSYIPTAAAQATRQADAASMTGANFSSWYRPGEGAFLVEYVGGTLSGTRAILESRPAAATTPSILMSFSVSGAARNRAVLTPTSGPTFFGGINSAVVGTTYKQAVAWNATEAANTLNGGAASTGVASGIWNTENLYIGSNVSTGHLCGHIRKLAYYPSRLSNTALQAITS